MAAAHWVHAFLRSERLGSRLAVICLCLAVYYPVLFQETTNYDDPLWISIAVPPNLQTLKEIVTSFPDRISPSLGYLAPVTASSMVLDLWIGGAIGNTDTAHKGVNLILHVCNALLVLSLMRRLDFTPWASLMVAGIFAVHPLQVSSVAWLAERKNLLMTCLFLLSVLFYVAYRRQGKAHHYAISLLAYLLSLLSKPSAVTLGPCLVLTDFCILDRRITVSSLLRAAPFIALAVAWGVMAMTSEGSVEHVQPLLDRILLFPYKVAFLIGKFIVPVGLCPIYPPVQVDSSSIFWWTPSLMFIAVGLLLWLVHRKVATWPFVWGTLFYVLNLMPASGLVAWKGMQELQVADHYQYTAIIGVATVVAVGAERIAESFSRNRALPAKAVLACIIIFPLSVVSVFDLKTWQNSETLWQKVIQRNPNSYTARYNYAEYLASKQRINEAINQYQHALVIGGDRIHRAYHNLGELLMLTRRPREAEECFKKAAAIAPGFWLPHASLTNIYFAAGDYEKALQHCIRTVALGGMCRPELIRSAMRKKPAHLNLPQ